MSTYEELQVTARLCRKYNISPGSIFSNAYLQGLEHKMEDSPVKKVKLQINQESEMQLEYLSRRFGLERKSLLDKLHQVSGDWKDLMSILTRPEQEKQFAWSGKEDQLLQEKSKGAEQRLQTNKSGPIILKRRLFLGQH